MLPGYVLQDQIQLIPDHHINHQGNRDQSTQVVQAGHGIVELTDHPDHPVVAIRLHQGPVVVILEVQDQVSGLLLPVAVPQVLSPAAADQEVVAPAVVDLEVEEGTNIIEADYLIQIITKNGKVV